MIEVIIVVVVAGILISVALRSAGVISETARIEETKQELELLATAIVGNPELENNGVRSDFGYVGDIGAMPPDLDALNSNPGGYSTWNGPYIDNDFSQSIDDYKTDAWGALYVYSGVNIISSGSGSDIVRTLGKSVNDFILNQVRGAVFDLDGTPPGPDYKDSVEVRLTIPNGAGGITTKSTTVDAGGYFSFDSIPIGNHDIDIVYLPDNDTLHRFVSVLPASSPYGEYSLAAEAWNTATGGGGIVKVSGSDSLSGDCNKFYFWIENTSTSPITIDSLKMTWTSPVAYYKEVEWNGSDVWENDNPRAGSGQWIVFDSPQTILPGQKLMIEFEGFKDSPTGGADVNMNNATFTIEFSDGSVITVNTGACP